MWLLFVLVHRLLAGLPTMFQSRPDHLYFFGSDGAFECTLHAAKLKTCIPTSTWCLIDANQHIIKPPMYIQDLSLYIVQAASPRPNRFKWSEKVIPFPFRFFMKPWTFSEIIVGYVDRSSFNCTLTDLIHSQMLQLEKHTEQSLQYFYEHFGPSTRAAYLSASDPTSYEKALEAKLGAINLDALQQIISAAIGLDLSEAITHQVFLIIPDTSRNSHNTIIATRYLYDKLYGKLHIHTTQAQDHLYSLFLGSPQSKSLAGHLLDTALHDVLCGGGQWLMDKMSPRNPGPKNTHWTLKPDGPVYRLRIGHQVGLVVVDDAPLDLNECHKPLRRFHFVRGSRITLQDGYYVPTYHNHPSFDSFIYESATATATVFQATVGLVHSAVDEGFAWLQERGVSNIQYIAVLSPVQSSFDLVVPTRSSLALDGKYGISLESLSS